MFSAAVLVGMLPSAGRAADATCAPPLVRFEESQVHMATTVRLTFYAADEAVARRASAAGFARIVELNRILSDYADDSELSVLCTKAGGPPVRVSAELFTVLERSNHWAEQSDGAFDVTMAPVIRLWRRARKAHRLPIPAELAEARKHVGWRNMVLDRRNQTVQLKEPGMLLDVGGIAKGYVGDEVLRTLRGHGVTRVLISLGGDVVAGDPPPGKDGWTVAVAALDRKDSQLPTKYVLANGAMSTSGDASQFAVINGKRYSHIIDPKTGYGLTKRIQTTVVARTGIEADGLDTTLNIMGVEKGLALIETIPDAAALYLWMDDAEKVKTAASRRWNALAKPAERAIAGPQG